MSRPSVLFVSPIIPAHTGNGLAMRAGATIRALAASYRVSLLVIPRYFSPWGLTVPADVADLCRTVVIQSEHEALAGPVAFPDVPFDLVHLFRLGTIPFAEHYLDAQTTTSRHLDLDDVESVSFRRIADRYRAHGREEEARQHLALAEEAASGEREHLSRFDRVYVCAAADIALLPNEVRGRAAVLPNVIEPTVTLAEPPPGRLDLLFVGTLGYFPNADGLDWFARRVLPILRREAPVPCTLRIVGVGMSPMVAAVGRLPGVEMVGFAPDLLPWYARSHVAIVPLFAGGGTRIKILEAFALGRPVVATRLGAEGLAVEDGRDILLADDPAAFAACCLRLIEDGDLRASLIARALDLVFDRHTPEVLTSVVASGRSLPLR